MPGASPKEPSPGAWHGSILVADIVGSTELYERLGDAAARPMIAGCMETMTRTIGESDGRVVKTMGDGLLSVFERGVHAVQAALNLCDRVAALALEARVGVHCGSVLYERGDVYGDTVNTAARIAALAKPSEVLISCQQKDTLPPSMQALVREVAPIAVKGKREPLELFAILREPSLAGGQLTLAGSIDGKGGDRRLELAYRGRTFTLADDGEIRIGRGAGNEIEVRNPRASRNHARVFRRQSKFLLADGSANGTFVVPEGQDKLLVLREEVPLHGNGRIYLGSTPERGGDDPVLYRALG